LLRLSSDLWIKLTLSETAWRTKAFKVAASAREMTRATTLPSRSAAPTITNKPMNIWFKVIYLMLTSKKGISSLPQIIARPEDGEFSGMGFPAMEVVSWTWIAR
jgi:hypothetical protein